MFTVTSFLLKAPRHVHIRHRASLGKTFFTALMSQCSLGQQTYRSEVLSVSDPRYAHERKTIDSTKSNATDVGLPYDTKVESG